MSKLGASKVADDPVTANFHFREKGKVQPAGYKSMNIDQEVNVTVKGKVKQIGSSWDNGASFTVEISSCEIAFPAAPVSLSGAIDAAAKSRKKVK